MSKKIKIKESVFRNMVKESIEKVMLENYTITDSEKIMEYFWVKPSISNLNVDLFVDDGAAYERYGHQLLLYIRNGYDRSCNEFIAMSVNEMPMIFNDEIDYKITYNDIFDVQDFIQNNLYDLFRLANKQITHREFLSNIKTERYAIAESKMLLSEMATLRAEDSKLPMDIWLDEGATYIGHAPRLKFRASNEQRTTREFSSMLLTNPPSVENFPKNSPIKSKDIKRLEMFVINNLENLLKLANGEIDYANDFLPNMILV